MKAQQAFGRIRRRLTELPLGLTLTVLLIKLGFPFWHPDAVSIHPLASTTARLVFLSWRFG